MFCLQAPLDCDKQLAKNFWSESEKSIQNLSSKRKTLCHSDSNIPASLEKAGLRKREKWRKALSFRTRGTSDKRGTFECVNRSKCKEIAEIGSSLFRDSVKQCVLPVQTSLDKQLKLNGKDLLSSSLNFFQTRDIEFTNEYRSGGQENGEDKDCLTVERTGQSSFAETKNQKSEKRCLITQKSITNLKAIKNSPVQNRHCSVVIEGVLGEHSSKSEKHEECQSVLHLNSDFDFNRKKESCRDTDLFMPANKSLKRQKINSGTSFLSLCSLFSLSKSPTKTSKKIYGGNNETKSHDVSRIFQQNIITTSLSCCPLSSEKTESVSVDNLGKDSKQPVSNLVIINQSPKPINETLFSDVHSSTIGECLKYKSGSLFSSDSSFDTSDGIAPMASPEAVSSPDSVLSSPKLIQRSDEKPFLDHCRLIKFRDSFHDFNSPRSLSMGFGTSAKLKLLHEGDAQVCYLNHTRTIFKKVLSSKILRRWETHHIYLKDDCLCSKTPSGCFESSIPYSNLDEVYVVGRWDHGSRFCIRLVMSEGSLLLQTSNSLVRNQWLSSILWKKNMHKYRNILQTSTRPEVILKEIKGLIFSSLNTPLQDDCIRSVPIEIISRALKEDEIWNDRQLTEEVIVALAPLLEDSTPSPEMFRFFSRHCLSHPRSPVIVDVFTSVVQRILKRTMDFGKSPQMRRFVADYFKALHSQNDGDEAIRKFIGSVHGTSCGCPHPRVLPNLVAVNLAAVNLAFFEQKKALLTKSANETNFSEALQLLDKQLECFVTLFLTISDYEDWRLGLAQLLQPIPFPDDALSHQAFIKGFTPVIRKIGTDPRCEVHEMVLGIRENKEGWLNVFCPSSLVCKDEGVLWCQMLKTLFCCCCKRKSFLQKIIKHLGALLLVALRGHAVAQEMLCLMLEWRLFSGEDQEMQVVTTLQSNESGRQKYSELCKRQEHLRELQKEGGPRKLTLPSRSTDADVARLLSCGSFGNLECLSLAFTHVTSACAHYLIQLPSLRYLNLWATQFGDAGLIIIAEHLDKLQVLNLCETPVSDKGIAAIAAMRSLKKLNLNSTKLSPQTLDTLKMKLPTLQELDVRYTDAW